MTTVRALALPRNEDEPSVQMDRFLFGAGPAITPTRSWGKADMRFARASSDQADPHFHAANLVTAHQIDVYVGRRIRELRGKLGISQGRLGRQLGLTFSQVQKYEKGSNRIGAGRLYHIAAILEVPVQYFFDGFEGRQVLDEKNGSEIITDPDAQRMRDLFVQIDEPNARRALLSLASSIASS